MKFSLATWNSLADCYVRGQVGGQDSRGKWESRSQLLRETLLEAMDTIDIFCMQEVDHFEDFYSELFESKGFTTVYMQRPAKSDGCLVGFNSSRFELRQAQLIDLDQLSHLDRQLQRTGRSKFAKQNVAVLVLVADKSSGEQALLATCHLHWNPDLPEVKFAQAYYITDRISSFREQYGNFPVVFTGDFNSLPSDEVYRFITAPPPLRGTTFSSIEAALANQIELNSYTFGPSTRFLCDTSLSRLCRWMRILGVDVAQDTWDAKADLGLMATIEEGSHSLRSSRSSSDRLKKQSLLQFFQRARAERRVILTTSKTMLQRAACPPSYYVKPGNLEEAMVDIYREFGLEVRKERFLTVCGKCGGEIEETTLGDARMDGKLLPTDRQVFVCVQCSQPYWWSDNENSSPAKAMRQADMLHDMIIQGLQQRDLPPAPFSTCKATVQHIMSSLANDPDPVTRHIKDWSSSSSGERHEMGENISDSPFEKAASLASNCTESPLSARFAVRDAVLTSSSKQRTSLPSSLAGPREAARWLSLESRSTGLGASTAMAAVASRTIEEATGGSEPSTPSDTSRTHDGRVEMLVELRSVFADHEPPLTNWNGSFTGTLDYIFVSKDWVVENVRLAPRPLVGEEAALERPSGKGMCASVKGSQPSLQWPSDHFMIIASLSL